LIQNFPKRKKRKKDENGKNKKDENNKENKEKDKVTDKKKQEEEKKEEEDTKPVEEEKKETEKKTILLPPDQRKEETKPVERISKTIFIAPSLDVDLYLREPLNEATVKEGQALYFSVTKPVTYKGDVIIERGATARGKVISVGKKKIGIIINSVTAVNGQTLSIQPAELSGRIEDMVRNRNYSANLKREITIKF
jgi:hypothetical protein